MNAPALPEEVLAFWRAAGPQRWFGKDEGFDRMFGERFIAAHEAAARGELDGWAEQAEGALALIILLDQFPRNAFRGTARMFATDPKARQIAREAIARGQDASTEPALQNFCYLPFQHSEDLNDQLYGESLTRPLGEDAAKWARTHREIIERFGRFPHRNAVLGRQTTEAEQRFLDEGGFSG